MKEVVVEAYYKELARRQRADVVSLHAKASHIITKFGHITGSAGQEQKVATMYYGHIRYQIWKSPDDENAPIRIMTGGAEMLQSSPITDLEESRAEGDIQELATLCVKGDNIDNTRIDGRMVVPDAYILGLERVALAVNLWNDLLAANDQI